LYENRFRVCENSPSLWPTMSCETVTGVYVFPLCTMKRSLRPIPRQRAYNEEERKKGTHPTKLGRIVHERAWVNMGTLFSRVSRRFGNATKYGPRYRMHTVSTRYM
jgi:hypothetical protein